MIEPNRECGGHVLVVDDDQAIQLFVTELLKNHGYRVTAFSDVDAALDYLQSHPPPNLVLVDLMMPHKNGWVFVAELQENPSLRSIPVVLMSGVSDVASEAGLFNVFYLAKPVSPQVLLATVECYRR
jgi:CheY-like chemotaxis protein